MVIFREKLTFLMNLTSTSNRKLADAINVDPSYISLLRTGRRSAPKNTDHTKSMAVYFSKKCDEKHQRIALSEVMEHTQVPLNADAQQLSSAIFCWLTNSRDYTEKFLRSFEVFTLDEPAAFSETEHGGDSIRADSSVYYGNDGKRAAVSAFAQHLLSLDTVGTINISMDENVDWLLEDNKYRLNLEGQMRVLLGRGFRLQRIAAPIYSVEQAFESLSSWLPLYVSGQMESFYYPRLRDNVYKRTLIVSPGEASVSSASIGNRSVSGATLFTRNPRMVNAVEEEFRDYLEKCRPMSTPYSATRDYSALLRCISKFEGDIGARIQLSTSLSSVTTPLELVHDVVLHSPAQMQDTLANTLIYSDAAFRESLSNYEAIDIISSASPEAVRNGTVPIAASYVLGKEPMFYTPQTYILHLKNILSLIEQYDNYCPILNRHNESAYSLMVKEGRDVLLMRPTLPFVILEISQPYIAQACREYLLQEHDVPISSAEIKKESAAKLRSLIAELECG